MFNKKWAADAAERVIVTAAEALLAVLTVSSMAWGQKLQVTGVAALASALKCLIATQVGADTTAALLPVGPDTEKGHTDALLVIVAVIFLALGYLICKVAG